GEDALVAVARGLGRADPYGKHHRRLGIAEEELVAVVDGDLVLDRGVDRDLAVASLHGRAVRRSQVAVDDLVILPEELSVVGRQVVVGEGDGVGLGTTQGDLRVLAAVELIAASGGGACADFEEDQGHSIIALTPIVTQLFVPRERGGRTILEDSMPLPSRVLLAFGAPKSSDDPDEAGRQAVDSLAAGVGREGLAVGEG